jgi:hypothetical protein
METKPDKRSIRPLVLIFVITSALFVAGRSILERWNIDHQVLIVGNIILFGATLLSYYLYTRTLGSKNAYAVTRTMYASVLARMFICLVAAFIYIISVGKNVSKGGIIGCMVLYFVYTGVEVAVLTKMSKQQKNA